MDVIYIHPYTGAVAPTSCWNDSNGCKAVDAFCGIEAVRDVMVAHGDSAKPMWLTEVGWSTYTGTYGVSEEKQAQYLTDSFTWLSSRPYVTNAFWYAFRNTYWLEDDLSSGEANVGVLRTDYTSKPALTALAALGTTTTDDEPSATSTTTTTVPPTTTTMTTTPKREVPSEPVDPADIPEVRSIDDACPVDVVRHTIFEDVPVGEVHGRAVECLAW